ncbi:hypothetical protein M2132_000415 [Dysgonomonas sp. PH5-45]|nr:hypothetical protein [Dysgonomonas sp. PH5-45]MDH6387056.1 hypothetical protein [Dysgonomonas sp. PH5-37]
MRFSSVISTLYNNEENYLREELAVRLTPFAFTKHSLDILSSVGIFIINRK